MVTPRPICFRLLKQVVCRAFSRACANTGNRIAARIAMMAITTSSSISVKPYRDLIRMAASSGTIARRQDEQIMLAQGARLFLPVGGVPVRGGSGRPTEMLASYSNKSREGEFAGVRTTRPHVGGSGMRTDPP